MSEARERAKTPESAARSPLERALGIVTEVRAGEGITALLLTLNGFLLLTAYYVIKPVREGLILNMPGDRGEFFKSYRSGAIAIALLVVVPVYGRAADRFRKDKLVAGVTLFFASHLLVFYALSRSSLESKLGVVFFVWVGILNMSLVAQFWSFANDLYTEEQGKRLFALVGIGVSAGSALGAEVTTLLVKPLGTYQLMLVSAGFLVASATLTMVIARRERQRLLDGDPGGSSSAKDEHARAGEGGTFALVLRHRYLLFIAVFSTLFTLVNTNGEYMLGALVKAAGKAQAAAAHAADANVDPKASATDFVTAYYGRFFVYVNVAVLFLQTFVVSRLVKFGGLRIAFFVLPVIALLDASAIAFLPLLATITVGKTAENATDYSVNNTVRNMLWLPTTTEMKYKAKQAVDTFFVRMGDVGSAVCVGVFAQWLGWPVRTFAVIDIVLVALWLVVARNIIRENARLATGAKGVSQSSSRNL